MPKSDNQERDIIAAAERLMRIAEAAEGPSGYGTTPNFLGELGKIVADVRQQTRAALVEELLHDGPRNVYTLDEVREANKHLDSRTQLGALEKSQGIIETNNAWRSILLKAKGGDDE